MKILSNFESIYRFPSEQIEIKNGVSIHPRAQIDLVAEVVAADIKIGLVIAFEEEDDLDAYVNLDFENDLPWSVLPKIAIPLNIFAGADSDQVLGDVICTVLGPLAQLDISYHFGEETSEERKSGGYVIFALKISGYAAEVKCSWQSVKRYILLSSPIRVRLAHEEIK
ncbi:MAG: hypothetical protein Q7S32_04940 [bacterium]|nr:hypothetical protein [bacterium]